MRLQIEKMVAKTSERPSKDMTDQGQKKRTGGLFRTRDWTEEVLLFVGNLFYLLLRTFLKTKKTKLEMQFKKKDLNTC